MKSGVVDCILVLWIDPGPSLVVDEVSGSDCKERLIAKTHLAVETLWYIFKATVWRWFFTKKEVERSRRIKPARCIETYSREGESSC